MVHIYLLSRVRLSKFVHHLFPSLFIIFIAITRNRHIVINKLQQLKHKRNNGTFMRWYLTRSLQIRKMFMIFSPILQPNSALVVVSFFLLSMVSLLLLHLFYKKAQLYSHFFLENCTSTKIWAIQTVTVKLTASLLRQ